MADLPTYPGVYIEELSGGVKTIAGVATSITAFIGRARKGPVDEPVQIFSFSDYERQFGGLWNKSTMSFAVRDFFLNGGVQAVVVRVHNNATAAEIRLRTGQPFPDDALDLEAVNPGTWGNKLGVKIDHNTETPTDSKQFNITISAEGGTTEKYVNVTVDNTQPQFVARVLAENSLLLKVKDGSKIPNVRPMATGQDSSGNDIAITPLIPQPGTPISPVAPTGTGVAGSDGTHITDLQLFSGSGMTTNKKGLYALENVDLFNLLCITPYTDTAGIAPSSDDAKPTDVTTALIAAADKYCKDRRAMFLVDPHSTWNSMSAAKSGFTALSNAYPNIKSSYSSLFFPRLKMVNPLMNNLVEDYVPCGAVAGVIARTDVQRGVWKASAGIGATLVGVNQFTVALTDKENEVLNQLGINCLRTFAANKRVVWGSRTLQGADQQASDWKYIPVRRTALFMEESLIRGSKWVVFEPNDEPLWARIRLSVGAFMHGLFLQGAFQGSTPKDAYFVKCDRETTTQNDVNSGIVNILVGFAPLRRAEFILIKIQQLAGQVPS